MYGSQKFKDVEDLALNLSMFHKELFHPWFK
jgi:hypothetical protein